MIRNIQNICWRDGSPLCLYSAGYLKNFHMINVLPSFGLLRLHQTAPNFCEFFSKNMWLFQWKTQSMRVVFNSRESWKLTIWCQNNEYHQSNWYLDKILGIFYFNQIESGNSFEEKDEPYVPEDPEAHWENIQISSCYDPRDTNGQWMVNCNWFS